MSQAMGVNVKSEYFCDLKLDAWHYTSALHGTHGCFWGSMLFVETGRPCWNHPESRSGCKFPPPGHTDICWGSGPCQPVSQQRRNTNVQLGEEHPGYSALFGDSGSIISCVRRLLPKIFITENVVGFAHKQKYGIYQLQTPLDHFIKKMYQIYDGKGRQWFVAHICLATDASIWIFANRPRTALLTSKQTNAHI